MTNEQYNAMWAEVAVAGMAIGGTVAVLLCLVLGMLFVKAVTS